MAESDSGERSEDPTAKKLSDARNKGQIARSKELGTLFVLIGAAVSLIMVGESLVLALSNTMKRLFSMTREEVMDTSQMFLLIADSIYAVALPLGWIFAIVAIAAFVGNILLGGYNFSWSAIGPKASKLSPIAGFKRMLGPQAGIELIKSLLKFFVVLLVALALLTGLFTEIIALSLEAVPINFGHAVSMLLWMFLALACSLIIICVVDVPYQLWNHKKQLKMTKQEVKDEMKNAEGSPEIKGRIRRAQYEMSQRRMMQDVPSADVVITNPTHFSVALKYDPEQGGAPMMVAKGADEMAMHIRTIAKEHGVEIVQSPALARSLFYTAEVNEEIPEALFAAVAQILAFIFQLKMHRQGKGRQPTPVSSNLTIPDDYRY